MKNPHGQSSSSTHTVSLAFASLPVRVLGARPYLRLQEYASNLSKPSTHALTHTRYANVRRMFPGLGLGVAAFLVLVAVEEFYWKPNHPDDSSHH